MPVDEAETEGSSEADKPFSEFRFDFFLCGNASQSCEEEDILKAVPL